MKKCICDEFDYEVLPDAIREAVTIALDKKLDKELRAWGYSQDFKLSRPVNFLSYKKSKKARCEIDIDTPDGIKTILVTFEFKKK